MLSENGGWWIQSLCSPLPHSALPISSRKELIPLSGALIFASAARGNIYIDWLWYSVELMLVDPTGL